MEELTDRQRAEEDLRLTWVRKLANLIEEADLPLRQYAKEAQDKEGIMNTCAGNRRARTIRQHCRKWMKIRDWMMKVVGVPFPSKLVHLTDYINHTLPGCPPTHPRSTAAALHFIETAGAIPTAERFSEHPIWVKVIESAVAQASNGKD